jgi:hypothetical protein
VEVDGAGPVVERTVRMGLGKVDGVQVEMVGRLDVLLRRRVGGGLWVTDHKTTGSLTEWWKSDQDMASQYLGYEVMVEAELERHVAGTMVHGIQLPNLNSSDRKCPKHPGKMYKECAPLHLTHEWYIVPHTAYEKTVWKRDALKWAGEWVGITQSVETLKDVRRLAQRGRWNGGCKFCPLKAWCRGGQPVHAQALAGFEVDKWNPLARAEQKGGGE